MLRSLLVVVSAVALGLASTPASAHEPPLPAGGVPAGTWYGEAPAGVYVLQPAMPAPADPVQTLPGARLLLQLSDTQRPDGTRGPAWYWFNTRAGSRFSHVACAADGVTAVRPVPRKRFQALVRSTHEREVRIVYVAGRNLGAFELVTGCPPAPGSTASAPDRPRSLEPDDELTGTQWAEGRRGVTDIVSTEVSDSLGLTAINREWLQLSWFGGDSTYTRWFGTGPGSTFWMDFCDPAGNRYLAEVPRDELVRRATTTAEASVAFDYDPDEDSGRFTVRTYWDDQPCEVRPRG